MKFIAQHTLERGASIDVSAELQTGTFIPRLKRIVIFAISWKTKHNIFDK